MEAGWGEKKQRCSAAATWHREAEGEGRGGGAVAEGGVGCGEHWPLSGLHRTVAVCSSTIQRVGLPGTSGAVVSTASSGEAGSASAEREGSSMRYMAGEAPGARWEISTRTIPGGDTKCTGPRLGAPALSVNGERGGV